MLPELERLVRVPTEVMLGCAAVVTVAAVDAADTVPVTLPPGMFVPSGSDTRIVVVLGG